MTTWEGTDSKTEDGTWRTRAATEAEGANRYVDETKAIEVQDDAVPEHDEGGPSRMIQERMATCSTERHQL